jgi:formylglycine-generating enzyme required for sulfatase activity/serine/threonine protein kinase
MGAVVLATDTRLGRKVAIKRILGEAAGNRVAVTRFLTEAKAIAALNHPNIVQIYDSGRAKDGPFLIMEYVDGGSLLDRCLVGALPLDEAIDLACHLCDGLAKAHDAGIIHRDIKPANVLLTKDGTPKLADFGLAKAESGDHRQTTTDAVLGTPDFMPLEQRRGASEVDTRSDLWSLAATIYQMVTGRSPKVIRFDLLPAQLTKVLGKALEEEKADRYQTARELREGLKASLRVAAAASGVIVLEGQCPACGTVNTDSGRKFCRNPTCGVSLRKVCLQCQAQMPAWEAICGECGCNQSKQLAEIRSALETKQNAAMQRLAEFAFDEALSLSEELAASKLPELSDVAEWGRLFTEQVTDERLRQEAVVVEKLAEAAAHRTSFDYPAAIRVLETIPQPLCTAAVSRLLSACRQQGKEATQLIEMITDRVKRKEIEGLLPLVERAVTLRGDRLDLIKIKCQLVDRVEERVRLAQTAFDGGDAFAALNALSGVAVEELGESVHLLDRVTKAAEKETRLFAFIKAAKIDGVIDHDEALEICWRGEACLAVNPASDRVKRVIGQAREILWNQTLRRREQEDVAKRMSSQIAASPALTNSVGISLKLLPAGSFTMGTVGESDEKPYRVTLTQPFYMGVYEVTNAQWKKVMRSVPSQWQQADGPVEQVSWEDAVEFCRKLSSLPAELKAGRVYRLPTEAEWEYACRAGTTTMYSFGDDEEFLFNYGWFDGNSDKQAHPVGQKEPNAWGLYDMHGNVGEWCSDWYREHLDVDVTNPQGPSDGWYRVHRGGCWKFTARDCRSASRARDAQWFRCNALGFRLALSPSGSESPEVGK